MNKLYSAQPLLCRSLSGSGRYLLYHTKLSTSPNRINPVSVKRILSKAPSPNRVKGTFASDGHRGDGNFRLFEWWPLTNTYPDRNNSNDPGKNFWPIYLLYHHSEKSSHHPLRCTIDLDLPEHRSVVLKSIAGDILPLWFQP